MREEIFGPVLVVAKFKTEEEAIQLANDTSYGLGAGVHSSRRQLIYASLLTTQTFHQRMQISA